MDETDRPAGFAAGWSRSRDMEVAAVQDKDKHSRSAARRRWKLAGDDERRYRNRCLRHAVGSRRWLSTVAEKRTLLVKC